MDERDEIREETDKIILEIQNDEDFQDAGYILRAKYRDKFLTLLDSRGLRRVVEKELPDMAKNYIDDWLRGYRKCGEDMVKEGWRYTERLIE